MAPFVIDSNEKAALPHIYPVSEKMKPNNPLIVMI